MEYHLPSQPSDPCRQALSSGVSTSRLWRRMAFGVALLLGGCSMFLMGYHSSPWSNQLAATYLAAFQPGLPGAYARSNDNAGLISTTPFVTKVNAKVLITGTAGSLRDASVLFDSMTNRILYAGSAASVPSDIVANQSIEVAAAMPGLWDCHTHFMGRLSDKTPFKAYGFLSAEYPMNYVRFQSAVTELEEALMMGITSVREVGGPFGQAIRILERSGQIVAPHFHYAGRAIGMTSGHADDQLQPLDEYRKQDRRHDSAGTLCDGPAECLKRERENLRMEADVIKIMTSGGELSEFDSPTAAEMSPEEIAVVTADAKRAGRAVAAHAHAQAGIQNAIDNGVTSIEHGSYMTRAQAREIKKKEYMIYTPVITVEQQLFNGTQKPAFLDDNQWRKGRAALVRHMESVRIAIDEGVTIVTGTDCPNGCGLVGKEIGYLHMLGMTPLQAIQAATGDAPRCMGQFGMMPLSGRLEKGYEADVIALSTNPLDDLSVLTKRDKITHVWKAGKLVKGTEAQALPI